MKQLKLFYILISCLFLTGCFMSDNVVDNFTDLNISLGFSNTKLSFHNWQLIKRMHENSAFNKEIVAQADSLHCVFVKASGFIDKLSTTMGEKDAKGGDIGIAAGIMQSGDNTKCLRKTIDNIYRISAGFFVEQHAIQQDTILKPLAKIKSDTAWVEKNFNESIPTIVAMVNLSKLENICLVIEKHSLLILKKQAIKK